MLKWTTDPRRRGAELTPCGESFTTKSGWYVEGFIDEAGTNYERLRKGRRVRWLVLSLDDK